jgi:hypothetical protein
MIMKNETTRTYCVNYTDWNNWDQMEYVDAVNKTDAMRQFFATVGERECQHVESVVLMYNRETA